MGEEGGEGGRGACVGLVWVVRKVQGQRIPGVAADGWFHTVLIL